MFRKLFKMYDMKKIKEKEEQLNNEIEESGGLEKNDFLAMLLAAYKTIFLPVLLIMGFIALCVVLL